MTASEYSELQEALDRLEAAVHVARAMTPDMFRPMVETAPIAGGNPVRYFLLGDFAICDRRQFRSFYSSLRSEKTSVLDPAKDTVGA